MRETVIEGGRRDFQPVYNACWDKIVASEADGHAACRIRARRAECVKRRPAARLQLTKDPIELLISAIKVRPKATQLVQSLSSSVGARRAVRRHGVKMTSDRDCGRRRTRGTLRRVHSGDRTAAVARRVPTMVDAPMQNHY